MTDYMKSTYNKLITLNNFIILHIQGVQTKLDERVQTLVEFGFNASDARKVLEVFISNNINNNIYPLLLKLKIKYLKLFEWKNNYL